jgi:hypothetical protein
MLMLTVDSRDCISEVHLLIPHLIQEVEGGDHSRRRTRKDVVVLVALGLGSLFAQEDCHLAIFGIQATM